MLPLFFFPENCLKLFNSTSKYYLLVYSGAVCLGSLNCHSWSCEDLSFRVAFFQPGVCFQAVLPTMNVYVAGSGGRDARGGLPVPPGSSLGPRRSHPPGRMLVGPPAWSFKYAWQRGLIPASNICFELCGGQMARRTLRSGRTFFYNCFQISDTVARVMAA